MNFVSTILFYVQVTVYSIYIYQITELSLLFYRQFDAQTASPNITQQPQKVFLQAVILIIKHLAIL